MPMPLRPNSPMQRGMRSRMMPPSSFYGGMPYNNYYQPQQIPMQMHSGPMMSRNKGGRGGGLLAKLLGRGNQQGGGVLGAIPSMNRAASSGGGGILQTLTNPQTLNGFLNNTQTILKTAQQLGPVIQQYGPLVKNLPSLWKLYRGLKDATNESTENSEDPPSESPESMHEIEKIDEIVEVKQAEPAINTNSMNANRTNTKSRNRSIPKLYI